MVKLVSLLAFSTTVDTTTVFVSKRLSILLSVLGLVVFCLVHGGSEKMRKIRSNNSVSKELIFRLRICYKDLASMQHIVLLGVAPLK